ncbi:MAG: NTP transferase domain-containing protein [Chlamydiae bacterium]|nr:NTP transferase domain-containing protein [Chlamydiota bacterium]MBI3277264.1 NTP transferase domain-containing protein [Chlamydiota bacterium]
MKALILAAGVGKRLSPFTDHTPKCLIEMGGTTILERMLSCLEKVGIREVFIVVGHLKNKIFEKVGNSLGGLSISYIENDRYHEGGILSLWAARPILEKDDFLIMDADVLFPFPMLEKLIQSPHRNSFLLDENFQDTGEEMKLGIQRGQVCEISKNLSSSYEKVGEGIGFLKVGKENLPSLVSKLDTFYKRGQVTCEYETVLNEWIKSEKVGYTDIHGLPWTEIDFEEDLRKAWLRILPKVEKLEEAKKIKPLNRRLSSPITRFFLKTPLTPNMITLLSFFSGLIGLFFFSRGSYLTSLCGAIFFQLFYILDNCDGEVARAKHLSSRLGGWLDIGCDGIIHTLLFPLWAWGLYRASGQKAMLILGGISFIGVVVTVSIFMLKRIFNSKKIKEDVFKLSVKRMGLLAKVLEYLKQGDFSFLVLIVVFFNFREMFLWASAIGLHLFWIAILVFHLEEAPVG